jgi:hypothetical protein
MSNESELEMAQRHVREGHAIVGRQVALVARLEEKGLRTEEARRVLELLTECLAEHQKHLDRIRERGA